MSKKRKNDTKERKVVVENDIMKYNSIYEITDDDNLYLTIGIKLNTANVNIAGIDPENGIITLTAVEIDKESTMEERIKLAYDVIHEIQDQILTVQITKINKAQFELIVGMNDDTVNN